MGNLGIKARILIFAAAIVVIFNVNGYKTVYATDEVYIGGYPIIIEMYSEGVIVTSVTYDYIVEGQINKGDIITEINGNVVKCAADVKRILDEKPCVPVVVSISRANIRSTVKIMPELDVCTEKYKLGLSFKEQINGLGTMTFIKKNGEYRALGHSITDPETGANSDSARGFIYRSEIIGVKFAEGNNAGRLIGKCIDCGKPIGTITNNGKFGLSGIMCVESDGELYSVADKNSVKPGKAQICADINGQRKFYDIEIIKALKQSDAAEKSLVIKVTDKELLKQTGGIVQGMSGSPIIQNGKFVGAVTHVFTNDPTRGYGVYAQWMM